MAIKRYIANADNTITDALQVDLATRGTGSNMGAADVLEAFHIYGQVSEGTSSLVNTSEKSRILIQFDVDKMNEDRTSGLIPASGNVAWHLNLYNAPHAFTTPKDFKMVVKVCSGSWQEGHGLDMENYTDQTYEGTGSNWIRKGATGDGYTTWLSTGGDFAESVLSPAYTTSFVNGTEDLSIDISNVVEDWMTGGVKAAGTFRCTEGGTVPADYNNAEFTLTDAQGTSFVYHLDSSTATNSGNTIGISGLGTNSLVASKIKDAINATDILRITATVDTADVTVTMDDLGLAGNNAGGLGSIDITGSQGGGADRFNVSSNFQNGTGIPNYGLGVFLSASFETGSHSYYTKKFFARSSEYFFKRPNLEARWDDSKKDDAAHFVQSSSLATADDNINTLFLYNYVKGKLQNIPANPNHANTSVIYASVYSNSVGNIYDRIPLPVGGGVTTTGFHNVTGGIYIGPEGAVAGVYTASFAMSHSLSEIYPVWHYENNVAYHTGSKIDVNTINASNFNPNPKYITTVENMKPYYSAEETARFRLFVRNRNWDPNNYTTMQQTQTGAAIEDAYYSLCRTSDDYEIVSYGTGSSTSPQVTGSTESCTRLSYDLSGNYFDLDMSLLQKGYEYELKFAYYLNGSYREQKESFKFKVGE
jgi:hypothetical protein